MSPRRQKLITVILLFLFSISCREAIDNRKTMEDDKAWLKKQYDILRSAEKENSLSEFEYPLYIPEKYNPTEKDLEVFIKKNIDSEFEAKDTNFYEAGWNPTGTINAHPPDNIKGYLNYSNGVLTYQNLSIPYSSDKKSIEKCYELLKDFLQDNFYIDRENYIFLNYSIVSDVNKNVYAFSNWPFSKRPKLYAFNMARVIDDLPVLSDIGTIRVYVTENGYIWGVELGVYDFKKVDIEDKPLKISPTEAEQMANKKLQKYLFYSFNITDKDKSNYILTTTHLGYMPKQTKNQDSSSVPLIPTYVMEYRHASVIGERKFRNLKNNPKIISMTIPAI